MVNLSESLDEQIAQYVIDNAPINNLCLKCDCEMEVFEAYYSNPKTYQQKRNNEIWNEFTGGLADLVKTYIQASLEATKQ
jgi:hypothetical protein